MKRQFDDWFNTFRNSISSYDYYIDFKKVFKNVNKIKVPLCILDSLIGSKNIKQDFIKLAKEYDVILKCIPTLLAVRSKEIYCQDENNAILYDFDKCSNNINDYVYFMEKTGLFNLLEKHLINNLNDYVTGVETGLDSNGRKNRGGHLMEKLVERYIKKCNNIEYYREMKLSDIESKWNINLSDLSNKGKTEKRFDFVVKTNKNIYAIETNFYSSSGSKLNETARSYKTLALESRNINNFYFVWITDGLGWKSAKNNLEETFDVMDNMYNIKDLENGVLIKVFK